MFCRNGCGKKWGARGGSPLPPRQDEWERYCAQVTDWDVEEYLDVLP
jgi:hypothetical protein